MIRIIEKPTKLQAAGTVPKLIEEYIGQLNSQTPEVSIARMISPEGWSEPGQTPEFDEYTVVLSGVLRLETPEGVHELSAGQAVIVSKGHKVQYSTPFPGGAEYIAVCLPAFSPETVHRERH